MPLKANFKFFTLNSILVVWLLFWNEKKTFLFLINLIIINRLYGKILMLPLVCFKLFNWKSKIIKIKWKMFLLMVYSVLSSGGNLS
jgi:hypothetical protein